MQSITVLSVLLVGCFAYVLAMTSTRAVADEASEEGRLIFAERFDDGLDHWWVEGAQQVWVEDGRLHVKADPEDGPGAAGYAATIWCKKKFEGNVRVEFDAHVLHSQVGANNINFFLHYSDPSGKPLYDSRYMRATADYGYYHDLNGYIFTVIRDRKNAQEDKPARFRMRYCPGFNLMTENRDPMGIQAGKTYHVTIVKGPEKITLAVNGKQYLQAPSKPTPDHGLIGLRTFCTDLWWDNIEVYTLDGNQEES